MNADLVARLFAAGTPPELVAEVAAEFGRLRGLAEAASMPDPVAERRRAWDAEYRRNKRAEAKAVQARENVSGGRRVDTGGLHPTSTAAPALDKETSPRPPKEINPTPCECDTPAHVRAEPLRLAMAALIAGCLAARSASAKPTRIPLDWGPAKPLPDSVTALVALWPPGRLERELEGFRDYWAARSRDAARTDWDRVWWNRIRDQHDRIIRENGSAEVRTHRGAASRPGGDGFIRALHEAAGLGPADH